MFLIFCLGRLNVLPVGDLGFCKAVGTLYGFGAMPTLEEVRTLAVRWEPYRTVATWYLWRSHIEVPVLPG
jgi:DNA-3-methyladenine glycosylase II